MDKFAHMIVVVLALLLTTAFTGAGCGSDSKDCDDLFDDYQSALTRYHRLGDVEAGADALDAAYDYCDECSADPSACKGRAMREIVSAQGDEDFVSSPPFKPRD